MGQSVRASLAVSKKRGAPHFFAQYAKKFLKLGLIWGSAFLLSLIVLMLVFNLFVGRDHTALNETLYENVLFVGEPGFHHFQTDEGHGLTTYGENGLIVDKVVRDDVYRILFEGDSYLKSVQVPDAEKFTELVEQRWNASHPTLPVQTLNLGMEGLDMRTYLSFADNVDAAYQPDKVFLMLSMNDFRQIANRPEMLQRVAALNFAEPLISPIGDSTVKRVTNDLGLRAFMRQLRKQVEGFAQQGGGSEEETAVSAELSPEAVRIQLQALQAIWGDRLVILYHVWIPDLGAGLPETEYDFVMAEMDALGIPYVSLYEPFRAAFAAHTPPNGFDNSLLGHGHWNQLGHQLAADEILAYLETAVPQEAAR